MEECPFCHKEIQEASLQCGECGKWLDSSAEVLEGKGEYTNYKKRGPSWRSIYVAVFIILLIGSFSRAIRNHDKWNRPTKANQSISSHTESNSNDERTAQLIKQLNAFADEQNKNLPRSVDRETRMDTVLIGPGLKITYAFTMVNLSSDDIADADIQKFRASQMRGVCTSEMQYLLEKKVVVSYLYRDKIGNVFMRNNISLSDCSF